MLELRSTIGENFDGMAQGGPCALSCLYSWTKNILGTRSIAMSSCHRGCHIIKFIYPEETGTSSTCPVCSHSLVCYKDSSYFVGIKTLYKQDIFQVCGKWKNIVPWIEQGIEYQKQVCGVHKTCSI